MFLLLLILWTLSASLQRVRPAHAAKLARGRLSPQTNMASAMLPPTGSEHLMKPSTLLCLLLSVVKPHTIGTRMIANWIPKQTSR
eukprot:3220443-Amphidinium_carterae.1